MLRLSLSFALTCILNSLPCIESHEWAFFSANFDSLNCVPFAHLINRTAFLCCILLSLCSFFHSERKIDTLVVLHRNAMLPPELSQKLQLICCCSFNQIKNTFTALFYRFVGDVKSFKEHFYYISNRKSETKREIMLRCFSTLVCATFGCAPKMLPFWLTSIPAICIMKLKIIWNYSYNSICIGFSPYFMRTAQVFQR